MLSKREFLKAVVGLTTLVGTHSSLAKEAAQFPMKRTAIVYYSHSGNTRTVASRISALTAAPVFEIVPQTPIARQQIKCERKCKKVICRQFMLHPLI